MNGFQAWGRRVLRLRDFHPGIGPGIPRAKIIHHLLLQVQIILGLVITEGMRLLFVLGLVFVVLAEDIQLLTPVQDSFPLRT